MAHMMCPKTAEAAPSLELKKPNPLYNGILPLRSKQSEIGSAKTRSC